MNIGKAFFAGVIGGAAACLIMAIARASGASADIVQMMGTLPGHAPSQATWLLGFVMMVVGSGLVGILYAAIFEKLLHHSGVKAGLFVALVHVAIGGLLLGLIGAIHPLVPNVLPSPGFFMAAYGGLGVIAHLLSHFAFGAIVGGLYGPVPAGKTSLLD